MRRYGSLFIGKDNYCAYARAEQRLKKYGECHEANPSKMSEGAKSVTGSAPLVRSPHADHRLAKVDARKKVRESYAALIDPLVLHGN